VKTETFEDIAHAFDFATHKRGFVLVGEPGAGKSTALRHLMLRAIEHSRGRATRSTLRS
jgi:ABC-type phosphate/phosphonate transport system ATPase subunit